MSPWSLDLDIVIKILMACLLGGMVGLERESINRPAGLRTHILVCVGSTLVMCVNAILVTTYSHTVNLDPGRFGAAVLSGIGFLGAGTIMREGNSVSGLTTAASLWTVACIGIAVGAGYLAVSVFTTLLVLIVLLGFAYFEKKVSIGSRIKKFHIEIDNRPGQIGRIGEITGKHECVIQNISLEALSETRSVIHLALKYPKQFKLALFVDDIKLVEGILKIEETSALNR